MTGLGGFNGNPYDGFDNKFVIKYLLGFDDKITFSNV